MKEEITVPLFPAETINGGDLCWDTFKKEFFVAAPHEVEGLRRRGVSYRRVQPLFEPHTLTKV